MDPRAALFGPPLSLEMVSEIGLACILCTVGIVWRFILETWMGFADALPSRIPNPCLLVPSAGWQFEESCLAFPLKI